MSEMQNSHRLITLADEAKALGLRVEEFFDSDYIVVYAR